MIYVNALASNGEMFFDRLGDVEPLYGPSITDANFHQVALTKAGSEVLFYLDGTAYPAPSYTTTFSFTSSIGFGYQSDSQDQSLLGLMDEISFSTARFRPRKFRRFTRGKNNGGPVVQPAT